MSAETDIISALYYIARILYHYYDGINPYGHPQFEVNQFTDKV